MSQAGQEVILKSVIGCFKLPLGLYNEIEALIKKKNCWGHHGDRKKIHWVKWDVLTNSKSMGKMGFIRDLALFNDSLLAKQAWRLLKNTNSLFYKVFKRDSSQIAQSWRRRIQDRVFYAWRSIL